MTRKTQKKLRKILTLVSCAVLLVCVTVVGTIAYLQATTNTVTNTFTVGNVNFGDPALEDGLDEAEVDEYGENPVSNVRVTSNQYKLVPGHSYIKDPIVHMSSTSEDAWLFAQVNNGISEIEDSYTWTDEEGNEHSGTIADQMEELGWTLLDDESNVYYYEDTVSASDNIPVFKGFAVNGDADVTGYADAEITILAYAVQADGFGSAQAAWDATYGADATTGA